ncbi:hypothetical protein SD71_04615 [Cohnella kolymensis]|uniref:NAD-dependent epimerase/dehydratase domain-containing protein n=1 Tax=Cohnella kolymensis TaxID=1590652 RepID=A0ABR5A7L0_9BACL|nr:NAD-dependent epimerase/dehydratase family protein [Cohnella kolymensis]KIL36981.1 hypothetical protein SD71_04615 [Cohnella kolymensis]
MDIEQKGARSAVITGATGFIGAYLVRKMLVEGWNIHLICRSNANLERIRDITNELKLHVYDGSASHLNRIMDEARPHVVIHLAAMVITEYTPLDIEPMIQSNVLFGTQIAEAMVRAGCHYLINTGTLQQHFEGKPYGPTSLYAATKQAFDDILEYYIDTTPLKVVTLKLSHVYGPDDPKQKLFSLLRHAANMEQPLMMSPGHQLIDLVYIDDVVEAFYLAAMRFDEPMTAKHEKYYVSSGHPLELKELVSLYEKVTGKTISVHWGGRPYREREMMFPWPIGERVPGWQVTVLLEEGIRKMECPALE